MQKVSTITSKGQVVIPKSIRSLYSLGPNTKVIFEPAGETITIKLLKNNFANLNKKLAAFAIDKNVRKDWGKSLNQKLEQQQW